MMIELKNIYKSYVRENYILKALNLTINKGDFISICGKSGCGKSTLLNILGTLDSITKGEYIFNGKSIESMDNEWLSKFRNNQLGFVFQSYNLISGMSVYDNVVLPYLYSRQRFAQEEKSYINELLEKLDIAPLKDKSVDLLSGGEKQRVCIARALAKKSDIIIADEPTGNLDPVNTREVMNIFSQLNKEGKTIIIVTHNNEVAKLARLQYYLEGGQILNADEEDTPISKSLLQASN